MRILVFFTFDVSLKQWFDMGFAERDLSIYHRLTEKGHTITFLTYGDAHDLDFQRETKNIRIIPVYQHLKRYKSLLVRIMQSLLIPFYFGYTFSKADVYKTNQMYGAWIPVLAKYIYGKKLVLRCGYEYFFDAMKRTNRKILRLLRLFPQYVLEFIAYGCADVVVISSDFGKRFVMNWFKTPGGKIAVVPNYVDTHEFRPALQNRRFHDRLVFVGRIHPVKNLLSLLEAVRQTEYALDVVGSGIQEDDLRKFASERNIRARFLGTIPNYELARILPKYAIFVLPSQYENSPKVLLEAMACGLGVIGSDVEGIREIITHGDNGLLCGKDAYSIRHAIEVLMKDNRLRRKLGNEARRTMESRFSLEKILDKEIQLYA
jgi:glycosyltransferase involved in cell wall biosynthesis